MFVVKKIRSQNVEEVNSQNPNIKLCEEEKLFWLQILSLIFSGFHRSVPYPKTYWSETVLLQGV